MSTIALLCIAALVAVVIISAVGAVSSGTASLEDVYTRRKAVTGDVAPIDPWATDARTHPELVPRQRTGLGPDLTADQVAFPAVQRQAA